MPTGDFSIVPDVIRELRRNDPASILDVGPGFGKWGFLAREYLELWGHQYYKKNQWKKRIDCCEVWRPYITDIHHYFYDNIYIKDVRSFVKEMESYDVIIMIDVLEHFEKEEGIKLLNDLFAKTNQALIIGTPLRWSPQGAAYGNIHEVHRSVWTWKEFEDLGFKKLGKVDRPILVVKRKNLNYSKDIK